MVASVNAFRAENRGAWSGPSCDPTGQQQTGDVLRRIGHIPNSSQSRKSTTTGLWCLQGDYSHHEANRRSARPTRQFGRGPCSYCKGQMMWEALYFALCDPPSTQFLVAAAAFMGTVLSVAIPLSFHIVSRIADRYDSDVIVRDFKRRVVVKCLPLLAAIGVSWTVFLRFLIKDTTQSPYWPICAWIALALFGFTVVFLGALSRLVMKYAFDSNYVLKRLFDAAEKALD